MVKETYICNGRTFPSYEKAVEYAASINCRVSNTQTVKKFTYLLTLQTL